MTGDSLKDSSEVHHHEFKARPVTMTAYFQQPRQWHRQRHRMSETIHPGLWFGPAVFKMGNRHPCRYIAWTSQNVFPSRSQLSHVLLSKTGLPEKVLEFGISFPTSPPTTLLMDRGDAPLPLGIWKGRGSSGQGPAQAPQRHLQNLSDSLILSGDSFQVTLLSGKKKHVSNEFKFMLGL